MVASGHRDANCFYLLKLVQSLDPSDAPSAALLVTAVWALRNDVAEGVDVHTAGLQLPGDAVGAGQVGRLDIGDESEVGVVGQADRFVLVLESHNGHHGPERLGFRERTVVVNSLKYGGSDVVTVR
jgi:hypothetical protein